MRFQRCDICIVRLVRHRSTGLFFRVQFIVFLGVTTITSTAFAETTKAPSVQLGGSGSIGIGHVANSTINIGVPVDQMASLLRARDEASAKAARDQILSGLRAEVRPIADELLRLARILGHGLDEQRRSVFAERMSVRLAQEQTTDKVSHLISAMSVLGSNIDRLLWLQQTNSEARRLIGADVGDAMASLDFQKAIELLGPFSESLQQMINPPDIAVTIDFERRRAEEAVAQFLLFDASKRCEPTLRTLQDWLKKAVDLEQSGSIGAASRLLRQIHYQALGATGELKYRDQQRVDNSDNYQRRLGWVKDEILRHLANTIPSIENIINETESMLRERLLNGFDKELDVLRQAVATATRQGGLNDVVGGGSERIFDATALMSILADFHRIKAALVDLNVKVNEVDRFRSTDTRPNRNLNALIVAVESLIRAAPYAQSNDYERATWELDQGSEESRRAEDGKQLRLRTEFRRRQSHSQAQWCPAEE